MINTELKNYIEDEILPRYNAFDLGHNCNHATSVITESLVLAHEHQANEEMAYVIAAYHDLGLEFNRKYHHFLSAIFLKRDKNLTNWFTREQISTMADAVEDHRASSKNPPRTIYGAIVAEADRDLAAALRRAVQFRLKDAKEGKITIDELVENTATHLKKKYGEEGYMNLTLHSIRNERNLTKLRALLTDEKQLKEEILKTYEAECPKTTNF